jgi:4-hydroxybenzoate polyprenyltransferase
MITLLRPARLKGKIRPPMLSMLRRFAFPIAGRWREGEGLLAAVNACYILLSRSASPLEDCLLSLLTLASLYAFNDFIDAEHDLGNPRKDQALARLFLEDRNGFVAALASLQFALIAEAFRLHGPAGARAAAGLFVINAIYSLALKGVPFLDVLCAAAWGGAYSMVAGAPTSLACIIGVATAICHCFQMDCDRGADRVNGVLTAAVYSPRLVNGILLACGAALFGLLNASLGTAAACSAACPVVFGLALRG